MLIPHDRGRSHRLNLSAYQLWVVVVLLVGLSFTTSFLFTRHQTFVREVERLRQSKKDLEIQFAKQTSHVGQTASTAQERIELEQRLRGEYDASLAAITAKLGELLDMEDQARSLTGLAPRTPSKNVVPAAAGGGKGGGASSLEDVAYEDADVMDTPPTVIEGLSHPSADLIIQEINVRTASLKELVGGLKAQKDQVLRLPSIWPIAGWQHAISSSFGYRKDPYSLRISRHDGLDITAIYGCPILATGKGVVVFSQYDGYLGNLVKIDHGNGIETWYAHMQTRLVKVGDTVNRKTVVGKLGSTGRSTGPHLHYEVHVSGRPVDPSKYLRD